MKVRPPLPPPPYLVVGLARSGVAAALALRRADQSAVILACDRDRPAEAIAAAERLGRAGVEVHLETDGTQLLAAGHQPGTLVKSPGVPADAPVVARARKLGSFVVGELEVGWRLTQNEFCAVTGTNGKTTTTELIGALYREAGLPVAVAGNIGTPVSSFAGAIDREATIVCEASSFQLEDSLMFAPEVGVFLNFSADHLDRHAGVGQYLDAKLRLFARQSEADVAVLNAAEPALRGHVIGGSARHIWFGDGPECDLQLARGSLLWHGERLLDTSELTLRGPHNVQNAMAAAAAALARGVDPQAVRSGLRRFRGIAHRLEEIAEVDGVLYVNDSKATNVAATVAALNAFEGGVHAILGGSLKDAGFEGLSQAVSARCRACYLIGDAADRLREDLSDAGVELVVSRDLERAIAEASRRARHGETVLLSPACASFDQYRDFEERGEHFRALVARIRERAAGAMEA